MVKTTEQVRIGYDTSNYAKVTVASNGAVTIDAVGSGAKFTFSDDVEVPDEAYGAGWNGSTEVPTKNALYDKIETISGGGVSDGDYGDVVVSGGGATWTLGTGVTVTAGFQALSTLDAGLDHALTLASGEDLTANRRLSFILSDANRSLTVSADTTLNGGTHSGTNTGDEPSATDSAEGVVELATTAEVLTGTDTVRAVTPDALAALWEQSSDVASGSTVTLGDEMFFNITGTTTITDIDLTTDKSGRMFALRFDGVLTLTHNATSLILPGGANITTAAGDVAMFVSLGSDNVRCISYQRAGGSGAGYAVTVSAADAATTTDAQTIYFGETFAVAPSTTAGNHRVYIPKAGIIRSARIWCQAATAGTNESWTIAIRLNNTTDTTVEALASNASYRVWSNNALGITVAAGDYIEIKSTNPTWATNPANVRFGGEIFIEKI